MLENDNKIIEEIKQLIMESRQKISYEVKNSMLLTYWNVGRIIVENEQNGKIKAEYGKQVIKDLSKELRKTFGSGFSVSNLFNMRKFYCVYSKFQTVSGKLSWSHYCELLVIENKEASDLLKEPYVFEFLGIPENKPIFEINVSAIP